MRQELIIKARGLVANEPALKQVTKALEILIKHDVPVVWRLMCPSNPTFSHARSIKEENTFAFGSGHKAGWDDSTDLFYSFLDLLNKASEQKK